MRVKLACVLLSVLIVFTFELRVSRSKTPNSLPKCLDTNTTSESCCPCFQESIDNCNQTCPADYLRVRKEADSVLCERPAADASTPSTTSDATTTTTFIATTVTMETENSTAMTDNHTTSFQSEDEEDPGYITICLKSCPKGQFYRNSTEECVDCDKKCLECAGLKGDNCIVCRLTFNSTCYEQCPKGTVISKNITADGSKLCEMRNKEENESSKLPFIVGGAAGGGVLVIVVIVIICCCCYRKRQNRDTGRTNGQRKAMSMLLEKQSSGDSSKEATSKPNSRRPHNYENASNTLPSGIEIQQHGDNVLRYTKDPTLPRDRSAENLQDEDEISPYGNAAMVQLAKNFDITGKRDEEVQEMLEIAEMDDAPKVPVQAQPKTPLPLSTKSAKRTGKPVVPEPQVHVPQDYMDMSGGQDSTTVDEGQGTHSDGSSLPDYENFSFNAIPQGRKADQTVISPQDDMENYENAANPQSNGGNVDNSDLEDYENTKELRKKPNKRKNVTGKKTATVQEVDGLEDYENMKDLELYENVQMNQIKLK